METTEGRVKTLDNLAPYRQILFPHFEKFELIPKMEHCDYLDVITTEGKALIIPDFRNPDLIKQFAAQTNDNWRRRKAGTYSPEHEMDKVYLEDLHSAQLKTGHVAWVKNRYYEAANHSPYVPFATADEAIKWLLRWGRPKAGATAFLQSYMRDVLAGDEDDTLGEFFYTLLGSKDTGIQLVDYEEELRFPSPSVLFRAQSGAPLLAAESREMGKSLFDLMSKLSVACRYNEAN